MEKRFRLDAPHEETYYLINIRAFRDKSGKPFYGLRQVTCRRNLSGVPCGLRHRKLVATVVILILGVPFHPVN